MAERPAGYGSDIKAVFEYGYRQGENHYVENTKGNFRILIFDKGQSVTVITHELGHLLGLADLETHNILMGYKGYGMQYQDIQGAALFNLKHTNHTFYRYIDLGSNVANRYRHICFYCDGYEDKNYIVANVTQLVQNPYVCSSHDYQPMVSMQNKAWDRCTACYKVRLAADNIYYESLEIHPSSPSCNSHLAVSGLVNNSRKVIIPNTVDTQKVVRIEDFAFSSHTEIQSIELSQSLSSIGNSAFFNCTGLVQVDVPKSVTKIEAYAFMQCTNLRRIYIPESVEEIGWSPFIFCPNLVIYVQQTSVPIGWDYTWNVSEVIYNYDPVGVEYRYHTVIWGAYA